MEFKSRMGLQIKLVAIQRDGSLGVVMSSEVETSLFAAPRTLPEAARSVIEQTVRLYESIGWNFPWVGYLAFEDDVCVGTCAFRGAPKHNAVEIAYHTFPAYEGRGLATRMAERLCSIAKTAAPNILITAQTRPEENASTRVLRKLGFVFKGSVVDPDIGAAWEWSDEN
jgi:ribosomal-protein-alanine N-acetyltransferase